jgi:hypothetical protein
MTKEERELDMFEAFAKQSPLNIDPGSARNEKPPMPDISSAIAGQPHHFELVRVFDEKMARRIAITNRTRKITGGAFSQDRTLINAVRKKAGKTYPVPNTSLDLLIYYDEQRSSFEALFDETRRELSSFLEDMTLKGRWNRVWIYDHNSRRILDVYPPAGGLWQRMFAKLKFWIAKLKFWILKQISMRAKVNP